MPAIRAFLVCLLLFPAVAYAQGTNVGFGTIRANPDAPVEVSADSLEVNQDTGSAIFTGNVVVGQGEMRLAAGRVKVIYTKDGGAIARMEASGGVTLVNGPEAAEAQNADYNIETGVIVMTGNVLLTQGNSALTAERMVVNLNSGTAQMSGRVKTVLGGNN